MRTFAMVAITLLALPLLAAQSDSPKLIDAVLERHFNSHQPFWAGQSIVSLSTLVPTAKEEGLLIGEIVKDPAIARQLASFKAEEIVVINPSVSKAFELGELEMAGDAIDWQKAAKKYPRASVVFKVYTPRYSANGSTAVVRIDGVETRGVNAGLRNSILYSATRNDDGTWTVGSGAAPAFL